MPDFIDNIFSREDFTTRKKTDEGFLRGEASLTRSGNIQYKAKELSIANGDPNRTVTVYRKPEHVFNEETISSIRGAVVTLEHPKDSVKPESWKKLSVGNVVGEPRRAGDLLVSDILVGDKDAIKKIETDGWSELSVGYSHGLVASDKNSGYDYETNSPLKINHVAIVERGRAGNRVRIFDSETTEESTMPEITVSQMNDAIASALKAHDVEQERKASEQSDIKDAIAETLKDVLPQILMDMGNGEHSQDVDPMYWKKVPVGKNYKPKTDAEDEEDMGNQGHSKMMKRGRKLGYDKPRSAAQKNPWSGMSGQTPYDKSKDSFIADMAMQVAGEDADETAVAMATSIAEAVLKDEMERISLMKAVSPMLTDEAKQVLTTASKREIMIAAVGDSLEDAESKSDDYLRAMIDMQAASYADEKPNNVYDFKDMAMTTKVPRGARQKADTVKVVGQDGFGEIHDYYQDYVQDLADAWMDEDERSSEQG